MRVLYVEDNPANVFLVKRVAKMGKHEIINYIDGGQALKKFDEIQPDLVLMDIQLAGDIGGLDVVRQLRGRGITVPIIAVTAYAMVGDKERCIEAGCDDYLAKPLPVPRLVEIFQDYSDKVNASLSTKEVAITEPPIAEKPEVTASPLQKDAENARTQEAEAAIEPVAQEVNTQEVQETSTNDAMIETSAEAEKIATGTLSKAETLPVATQTEPEISKESSETSSKT